MIQNIIFQNNSNSNNKNVGKNGNDNKNQKPNKNPNTNFFIIIACITFVVFVYQSMSGGGMSNSREVSFTEFMTLAETGRVREVNIEGRNIKALTTSNEKIRTYSPDYPNLVEKLQQNNVEIKADPIDNSVGIFLMLLTSLAPILIIVAIWFFAMKHFQSSGKNGLGFGKSKAQMLNEGEVNVTFDDVAGIEEAKNELSEVVDFLKDPVKYTRIGASIPKGCLLVGSPGTGKTLLAKSIAGEAKVPFFFISGSDFVEMFVGVGASRVRSMFAQAKEKAPCIIFIDEIDAVGRHRGAGYGGGNDEREQTLNQILVEMDGFQDNLGVIILAATNRPDVLDPALLRPGRFDRQIIVNLPDVKGRTDILNVHLKKIKKVPSVDASVIARGTPGFSGADLKNLVNESALLASREDRLSVTLIDLENAKDKVMMGVERKSMTMQDKEKKLTAYHEAGHAIVGLNMEHSDPIHKATIIPRGMALGMVVRLPEQDRVSLTRGKANADIAVAMGGRVAEEIIFGYEAVTSGASSDIKMATNMAESMVLKWGMSDELGPLLMVNENSNYLGNSSSQKVYSDETKKLIDSEVKKLVMEGYNTAYRILKEKDTDLHILAKALIKYETLSGDEITELLKNPSEFEAKYDNDSNSVSNNEEDGEFISVFS